ncbi:MAG: ATP-binding protein [Bryobacteraceae bacterium]|nr:ATP-binding protein [Bryobacteraceae bacterium]
MDELTPQEEIAQLRAQVREMYKHVAISRLSAGIIHEINSPIASIFSNIEVLEKSLDVVARQLEGTASQKTLRILETMRSLIQVDRLACERISGVIRSLKIHARLEDEGFQEVNLNDLLDDSIRLVNAEYKRRVQIVREYGELPPVECSPQLMSQVFLNILVNAAQAIEGEGTITVRTAMDGEKAHLSIADTGHGMSEDCKKRIFSAGFTTKPVGVGTGLGLTISRKIVEDRHGGSIDFESEVGRGTTFHIRIPAKQNRR